MENTATDETRGRLDTLRDEDRSSRELNERERDSFYYLPTGIDMGSIDVSTARQLQLLAPPHRIDPHWGKMMQRWVDVEMNNGARVGDMGRDHWRARDPNTIPQSYRSRTMQWNTKDVVMVANRMLLMEVPEKIFHERQMKKTQANKQIINDIRATHGQIRRDGEIISQKDQHLGRFSETVYVQPVSQDQHGSLDFAE